MSRRYDFPIMNVQTLIEALPGVEDRPALQDSAGRDIRYVDIGRSEFVEPPLVIEDGELETAQAVVVTAPAAVGKSMLAEFLALRTSGVLWNLGGFHVGNDFALGALARAHGASSLGAVLTRIHDGSFLVVADALDEARLRVSFDAFVAFLDGVFEQFLARATPGRPPLVLLARRETSEFAADWLGEAGRGAAVASLRIDFFDRAGAEEFVNRQLQSKDRDPTNPNLVAARDAMFAQILSLFGVDGASPNWEGDARKFLGYAPVLVAMGRYLASGGNPKRLAEQFAHERTPEAMWQFLLTLVIDILEREQQKFVQGFRESAASAAVPPTFLDWSAVFAPHEQRAWLLSEALGTEPPNVTVPREIEAEYRAQVREWLAEHPFVGGRRGEFASPVFEDFVYAEALTEGQLDERAAVRRRVADASYRPTEMLARFIFTRAAGHGEADAEDLPALYESLTAGEEQPGRLAELDLTDEGGLQAAVRLGSERFELPLNTGGAPIVFIRHLGRASVQLQDHSVKLGVSGRTFEIGPDVAIRAANIDIAAESLVVRRGTEEAANVVLSANTIFASDPVFRVVHGSEGLRLRAAQSLRYPLVQFAIEDEETIPALGADELEAAQVLFRLLGFFKSEGYGGLGSYAEPIDRRAGQHARFARLLSFAQERGLVTREGAIYKLHPDVVGLDYLKVKAQIVSNDAARFLHDFVRADTPGR
ncbi:MAG TPA: hypothetical protein VHJ34_15410 [Actinomycetota bacterium]|nr:hypothetical protein [Actinomycetota bacterium]